MVWSNWKGALVVLIAGAGLAWSQVPTTPQAGETGERIMVVNENGKRLRCRVLQTWQLPDGKTSHQLQVVDTGEMLTISDAADPQLAPGQGGAKRIYHWGVRGQPVPARVAQAPAPGADPGLQQVQHVEPPSSYQGQQPQRPVTNNSNVRHAELVQATGTPADSGVVSAAHAPLPVGNPTIQQVQNPPSTPKTDDPITLEVAPVPSPLATPDVRTAPPPAGPSMPAPTGPAITNQAPDAPPPSPDTDDVTPKIEVVPPTVPGVQDKIETAPVPTPLDTTGTPEKKAAPIPGPGTQDKVEVGPSPTGTTPPAIVPGATSEGTITTTSPGPTTTVIENGGCPTCETCGDGCCTECQVGPLRRAHVSLLSRLRNRNCDRVYNMDPIVQSSEPIVMQDGTIVTMPNGTIVNMPNGTIVNMQDGTIVNQSLPMEQGMPMPDAATTQRPGFFSKLFSRDRPGSTPANPPPPNPAALAKVPTPAPGTPLPATITPLPVSSAVPVAPRTESSGVRGFWTRADKNPAKTPGETMLDVPPKRAELVKLPPSDGCDVTPPPKASQRTDVLLSPEKFNPNDRLRANGVTPPSTSAPMATQTGGQWPAGTQSVLAARSGLVGSVTYIPVPTVTVPRPPHPPQPPVPTMPQAPQLNAYVNAFSPPPSEGPPQAMPPQCLPPQAYGGNPYAMAQARMSPGYPGPMMNPNAPPMGNPYLQQAAMYGQYAAQPPMVNPYAMGQAAQGYGYPMMPNYSNQTQQSPTNASRTYQGPLPPNPFGNQAPGVSQVGYYPPTPMAPAVDQVGQFARMLRESPYPAQREWAAQSLAACDLRANPQIVPVLLQAACQDPAPNVRTGCVYCIGRTGMCNNAVLGALQTLRSDADPRVRQEVEQAFARLGQPALAPR